MKWIAGIIVCLFLTTHINAQNEGVEEPHGFRKDRIFFGGSIGLGFGNLSTNIGANPEIGYSLSRFLDAGLSFNINYFSVKADPNFIINSNVRSRSFMLGGGPFIRLYPINNFFIQGQIEMNRIRNSEKYFSLPEGQNEFKQNINVTSNLVGVGYAQRIIGQSNFYTLIMIDISNNIASPYITGNGEKLPIIRAGFNIYLKSSK